MSEWPEYISNAFIHFYMTGTEEEPIEEFASRWGGLDLETFTHVLEVGQGQDKMIALFALGYSGQPEARATLLPFLHSQVRMERWASALCLGEVQEEQALPVLQDLLLEGLFDQQVAAPDTVEDVVWYEKYRGLVAYLLGSWENPRLVPLLRKALEASWQREQQVRAPAPLYPWAQDLAYYHAFQDALAFALGCLGAFGVLMQLEFPASRLRIALIHLILGHLSASKGYSYRDFPWQLWLDTALREDIFRVLEQQFGLSAAEGAEMLLQFSNDETARRREGSRTPR